MKKTKRKNDGFAAKLRALDFGDCWLLETDGTDVPAIRSLCSAYGLRLKCRFVTEYDRKAGIMRIRKEEVKDVHC